MDGAAFGFGLKMDRKAVVNGRTEKLVGKRMDGMEGERMLGIVWKTKNWINNLEDWVKADEQDERPEWKTPGRLHKMEDERLEEAERTGWKVDG